MRSPMLLPVLHPGDINSHEKALTESMEFHLAICHDWTALAYDDQPSSLKASNNPVSACDIIPLPYFEC